MNSALKGKPPTKREFVTPWHTTLSGWSWWGDSYMAIRGRPFWPDLETEDLSERMKRLPLRRTKNGSSPLRAMLLRVVRQHNGGDTLPVRLGEAATFDAPGCSYPVRVAYSVRNGQKLRGWPSVLKGHPGPCVVNAGFVVFIERRIGGGSWFVTPDRTCFVYDVDGRVRALVMGIRTNGASVKEAPA